MKKERLIFVVVSILVIIALIVIYIFSNSLFYAGKNDTPYKIYDVNEVAGDIEYFLNKTVTVEGYIPESLDDVEANYSVIYSINRTNGNTNRIVANLSSVNISDFKYYTYYFDPNKIYLFTGEIYLYFAENLQMNFPAMKVKTIVEK